MSNLGFKYQDQQVEIEEGPPSDKFNTVYTLWINGAEIDQFSFADDATRFELKLRVIQKAKEFIEAMVEKTSDIPF